MELILYSAAWQCGTPALACLPAGRGVPGRKKVSGTFSRPRPEGCFAEKVPDTFFRLNHDLPEESPEGESVLPDFGELSRAAATGKNCTKKSGNIHSLPLRR